MAPRTRSPCGETVPVGMLVRTDIRLRARRFGIVVEVPHA